MRERQLIHNLGETCTRWMVLIEKKLPKLVASSQRTRMDIGKLRRERPLKESANVKQVGYKDQIKKMKESMLFSPSTLMFIIMRVEVGACLKLTNAHAHSHPALRVFLLTLIIEND